MNPTIAAPPGPMDPPMETKRKGLRGFIFKIRVAIANWIVKSLQLKVYSMPEMREAFSQLNQLRSYVDGSGHLANHYKARQRIADHLNLAMGSLVSSEGRAGVNISHRHMFITMQYLKGLSKRGFNRAMRKKHLAALIEEAP